MPQRTDTALLDAVRNFDALPDSAYVNQKTVEALFCISSATVWRMVKRGALPKPDKLSERMSRFQVGKLRKANAARGAA